MLEWNIRKDANRVSVMGWFFQHEDSTTINSVFPHEEISHCLSGLRRWYPSISQLVTTGNLIVSCLSIKLWYSHHNVGSVPTEEKCLANTVPRVTGGR